MKLRLVVSAIGMAVALSGCATAYQPKGFTGGFSETMLSPDTFKIQFAGNGYTSAERASDFAILRAADKSLELGCNYFGVMNEADGASVGSITVGSASWNRHGAWGFSSTMPVVKPNTALFVKCFKDQQAGASLFDAHFIAQSIRAKYGIKPAVNAYATSAPSASPADLSPIANAPAAAKASVPDTPSVSEPQTADYASMVLSAQKLSTQMGCGDVKATGGTTFQAKCATYSVAIDCAGGTCHPIHTINN